MARGDALIPNMETKPDQNKTHDATPEQLMQMLDLQIASQRARRKNIANRRAIFIVVAILLVMGAGMALLVLQQQAQEKRELIRSGSLQPLEK